MRIVHFLKSMDLKGGGVVRALLDLCAGLSHHGHEVVLLTSEDADVDPKWKVDPGADPWARAASQPACMRIPVLDLRRELRRQKDYLLGPDFPTQYIPRSGLRAAARVLEKADLLHLHGPWASPNVQMGRLARKRALPYVVTAHGMLDDWSMGEHTLRKQIYLTLLSRTLLEHARAVHCTAQGEAAQSSKHFPKGRAVVIPLLVDMTPFRTLPGPERALARYPALRLPGLKILCVSRLHEVKGLDRVLRAAAGLKSAGQQVQLIFAGPSDPPTYADVLRNHARALGLEEQTHLLGMVSGADKTALYQAADVYVQPSIHENFGLSLVESLAAGTPIVTSKGVNVWPELHASGGAVVLDRPPSEDEAELRLVLSNLANDVSKRAQMGAAGRRWALELLDQDRIVAAYEAMYRGEGSDTPTAAALHSTPIRRTPISGSRSKSTASQS